ncbi:MAG: 2-hydroxyacyl-CoA dehydratase [Oscillospiraceae bacterium]|nr:2-hydroxyacyl-CoA dehydratase [Oscillospiraceae bacterium]MBQ1742015.1 2-hydroxyacyl-CoA dehydratase [Oscillospiraceae bacterium]MBQ2178210.1 2-hydroxyacyl-CoA dehydratase [Oscillospiraceae bacterium]MBQ2607508.1 2-hydroxyacyl-CoA dehydratase [Oscillospiraceae bacterium]MBQ5536107.1 2-hydroxyacyl-CoA dehydratase [Oscillospiraceae bacterium]
MRDLKHLIFFENLLDNADNELVEQAKADGGLAIGYTCFHIPEVILNVDKCFSVRLRAPRTGSIDIATFYMSNYTCEFARSLVERGIEGGFNFLDGLAGVDACSMMNRFYEHFELLKMNEKPNFFVTHTDMPYKVEDYSVRHYVKQMRVRLLDVMEKNYGVDTSDEALRRAVEEHNEVCRILTEIGEMRKADNPVITGYEYHVLNLVSYTCPKKLILPYLRETLSELKKRKPDPKPWYRARVAIVGSEIDDPSLTKMLEDCGAFVVADRYCYGSTPGREEIKLNDDEPVLDQICRHYMEVSECARYISDEKVQQRRDTAERLAREFKADGIIYEQMKFCDFWGFERALVSHIMSTERGWPVLSIDRPYNARSSGQLRTRFQAFVESLEIKRIQKNGGNANG